MGIRATHLSKKCSYKPLKAKYCQTAGNTMVLLNTVTRCHETEAPFYWLAHVLSEQLVQSF